MTETKLTTERVRQEVCYLTHEEKHHEARNLIEAYKDQQLAQARAEGLREAAGVVRDYATKNTLNLCGADNHLESLASSPGGGELERLRAELEHERVRLAGCGVAALGYGEPLEREAFGWSQSYQDVLDLRATNARLEARVEELDCRRREGRQLLRRFVKYTTEDRAVTPGLTRLARFTETVRDYLDRTGDPNDILRFAPDPIVAEREGRKA